MGERGAYGWTWLEEEKRVAAFFAAIEPPVDNVRWPVQTSWDPVSCAAAQLPPFSNYRCLGGGLHRANLDSYSKVTTGKPA